jgi:hypothetical protein
VPVVRRPGRRRLAGHRAAHAAASLHVAAVEIDDG